jgi:hypothetical protein
MTTTASIAELQSAGMRLEASEAVAIAQQLIQSLRRASASAAIEPPYGPPSAATVVLNADGSVSCSGCGSTPAICEVAIFLDSLIPAGSPHVPGALRYTIARALLEVDVPPFDSLDAFSEALARHERGNRAEVIRQLLQRSQSACAAAAMAQADRRRRQASATDLRRALREADARLYAVQKSSRTMPEPPRSETRALPAIAACLGAGLMLIAAGEFMQRSDSPSPALAPVAVPALGVVPDGERAAAPGAFNATDEQSAATPVSTLGSTAGAPAIAPPAPENARPTERVRTAVPRERADRDVPLRKPRPPAVKKTRAGRSGVLHRLRLGWLKTKFVIRADAL